jgi:hypothetical protein
LTIASVQLGTDSGTPFRRSGRQRRVGNLFSHCVCLKRTTVCRIFSCQRSLNVQPTVATFQCIVSVRLRALRYGVTAFAAVPSRSWPP